MTQNGRKVYKASSRTGPVGRIPFGIEVILPDGTPKVHEFEAVDQMPAGAQLMLAGYMGEDGEIRAVGVEAVVFVTKFFRMLMPRDVYARFDALANDPEVGMDIDPLIEIVQDLMEEITGRPTSPSRFSAAGQSTTAPSSTAASSLPASTSSPSPSPVS